LKILIISFRKHEEIIKILEEGSLFHSSYSKQSKAKNKIKIREKGRNIEIDA
jgi:hypothetical protein